MNPRSLALIRLSFFFFLFFFLFFLSFDNAETWPRFSLSADVEQAHLNPPSHLATAYFSSLFWMPFPSSHIAVIRSGASFCHCFSSLPEWSSARGDVRGETTGASLSYAVPSLSSQAHFTIAAKRRHSHIEKQGREATKELHQGENGRWWQIGKIWRGMGTKWHREAWVYFWCLWGSGDRG